MRRPGSIAGNRCGGRRILTSWHAKGKKVMQRKLFASVNLLLEGEAFTGGHHVSLIRELRVADSDRAEVVVREHLRYNKDRLLAVE